jgi:hypothetical protein
MQHIYQQLKPNGQYPAQKVSHHEVATKNGQFIHFSCLFFSRSSQKSAFCKSNDPVGSSMIRRDE